MKRLTTALLLAAGVVFAAQAADDKQPSPKATDAKTAPKTAQQAKMKQCNADAKGKTGDERKAFMKECLSKKS